MLNILELQLMDSISVQQFGFKLFLTTCCQHQVSKNMIGVSVSSSHTGIYEARTNIGACIQYAWAWGARNVSVS